MTDPYADGGAGTYAPEANYVDVPPNVSGWDAPKGDVPVGEIFGEAWSIGKSQLGPAFLTGLVFMVVMGFVNSLGVGFFLIGPLLGGLYYTIHRGMNVGNFEVGDLFKGFSVFVPTMLIAIVSSIFASIGVVLCIIPGILVIFMYSFAYLFVLDRKMDFWQAMEASRKLYFANFWSLSILFIVQGLFNFAGTLACYVGVFFTFPVTVIMTIVAYRRLVGFRETGDYEPSPE